MAKKIGVIQFPGSNCERETVNALQYYGMDPQLLRWTTPPAVFHNYDAYIIPGGFSFQDRVRAGVIAAKLPIMGDIVNAANSGKLVLGICNGCQILAESGLVPDTTHTQHIEMALAPNQKDTHSHGFICDWVFVTPKKPKQNVFTSLFEPTDIIPIPINHGEGRFVFQSTTQKTVSHFKYCTSNGEENTDYPTNPNGTSHNISGIGNKKGNVFAMMPHPERAYLCRQIPSWIPGEWPRKKQSFFVDEANAPGPWEKLFIALKEH
jgi:phosphoribosylformylglycinamidine synthase I